MDSFNNTLSDDDKLYLYTTDWYCARYAEALAKSAITGLPVPEDKLIPLEIIELREAARLRLSNG